MENVTFDYKFYRIPKRFFKEDMFRDMTNAAKVLYGILLDRKCLSDSNGDAWCDEYGITYIIFTIEEIMNLMNLGNKKVNKMVKELEEHGLIYRRHQGLGRPNKIYVYDLLKADNSNWLPKQIMYGKWSRNEKALKRIEELENENAELREELEYYKNRKLSGRQKHNAKWMAIYNDFVAGYESGMTMIEIARRNNVSERTIYRYKAYYDKMRKVEVDE